MVAQFLHNFMRRESFLYGGPLAVDSPGVAHRAEVMDFLAVCSVAIITVSPSLPRSMGKHGPIALARGTLDFEASHDFNRALAVLNLLQGLRNLDILILHDLCKTLPGGFVVR